MQRAKAPFRADEVGSLLRPPRIKEARARLEKGEISADDLRKAEDMEIEKVVHKQASTGLKLATDGEFRRSGWHFDFLKSLTGCELFHPDTGIQFAGVQTRHDAIRVIGKLDFPDDHPMLDHFRFLKKHADTAHVAAKMTIPSPAVLHFRGGRKSISNQVYPDLDAFYQDLGKTYRKAVKAFYDAGCRYLQFDDTVWAYLCSQDELKKARERGDNPDGLQEIYARVINYAIAERPADMMITTHVCRGNFRSTWISSGGYEPVAETMLAGTNYDGYFLEYDSERAGGFEPLRYLPKGNKIVVVGVITSKSGELEKKDDIKRRLEEASKFAPLDQLALSPQCGFASTEEGNILTEEQQGANLKLTADVACEGPLPKPEAIIVGAGPAGLASAMAIRAAGIEVAVFEKAESVGSVWRRHYNRLHLHTDRKHSGLPGMAMPPAYPTYPSRQQVVEYLESYAARFDIRPVFKTADSSIRHDGTQWCAHTAQGPICAPVVVV